MGGWGSHDARAIYVTKAHKNCGLFPALVKSAGFWPWAPGHLEIPRRHFPARCLDSSLPPSLLPRCIYCSMPI